MERQKNWSQAINVLSIDLSHGKLDVFPESIKRYTNLTKLNVSNNHFLTLPSYLSKMHSLVSVAGVNTNPMSLVPVTSLTEGWKSFKQYLQTMPQTIPWTSVKLFFVGKEGAGKTTLLARMKRIKHTENISTDGIAMSTVRCGKAKLGIDFDCFDLGGQAIYCTNQEKYRAFSLTTFFFTQNRHYTQVLFDTKSHLRGDF